MRGSFFAGLALAVAVIASSGCHVHEPRSSGPPPHAPAHGYRAKAHAWVYYPDCDLYYCEHHRNYWTVDAGGVWTTVEVLPPSFVVGFSVTLDLDTPEPWRFHADHRRAYPPGQAKKATGGGGPPPHANDGPKGPPPGRGGGPKPKGK